MFEIIKETPTYRLVRTDKELRLYVLQYDVFVNPYWVDSFNDTPIHSPMGRFVLEVLGENV